jgi:hypothetical protein
VLVGLSGMCYVRREGNAGVATAALRDNTALEAAGEGAYEEGERTILPPPTIPRGDAAPSLGQVATDGGFDLRAGVAVVQANLDQLLPRDDQVGL